MGVIDGLTKARTLAIEAAEIVSAAIVSGNLIFTRFDTTTFNAGSVVGPSGVGSVNVKAATTANITLSAPQTIDGIAVVAGNRVLVKNQTLPENNGIYVVAAGAWTRSTDSDTAAEVAVLGNVQITAGTVNGGNRWNTNFKDTDTLGTTAMNWLQNNEGLTSSLVRAATTANITLSAPQTIDGVAVTAGMRVLVKNQTLPENNGVYVVQAGAWTRATDADTSLKVGSLGIVQVPDGTINGGSRWSTNFKNSNTLGTTVMVWFNVAVSLSYNFKRRTFGDVIAQKLSTNITPYYTDPQWSYPGCNLDESLIAYASGLAQAAVLISANTSLYQLPPEMRPSRELMFTSNVAGDMARVKVDASGIISTPSALSVGAYVSLDQISFPSETLINAIPWIDLTANLQAGWSNYDAAHSVRGYIDSVGDLHLQGWVKAAGSTIGNMLQLPASLWSTGSGNLMYIAPTLDAATNAWARLDIIPAGLISVASYGTGFGSSVGICLDGIVIPGSLLNASALWTTFPMVNSWAAFGAPYYAYQIYRNPNGRIFTRGLIKSGTPNTAIGSQIHAALMKPIGSGLFSNIAGTGIVRIDASVTPAIAGTPSPTTGGYSQGGNNSYVNLCGISWDTIVR